MWQIVCLLMKIHNIFFVKIYAFPFLFPFLDKSDNGHAEERGTVVFWLSDYFTKK
jgi:hypothetical protein